MSGTNVGTDAARAAGGWVGGAAATVMVRFESHIFKLKGRSTEEKNAPYCGNAQ